MTRLEKIVLFACAFVILIHAVASFFPEERLWGINQLAFFSPVTRWIMIFLAIFILIPKVNSVLYRFFAGFFNLVDGSLRGINKFYKYLALSLSSMALFWVFRAATYLLGDGHLRGREIVEGTTFSVSEPLDFYLHVLAYRLLKLDVYQIYALISCLAGVLFVFLALWISYHMGRENRQRVLVFFVLMGMGSTQLLFGYRESYSLVYAAVMGYFLLSFLYLEGKSSLLWPSLALLASISLHLSAAYLVPSLIYLYLVDPKEERKRPGFERISQLVLVLALMGAGFVFLTSGSHGLGSITGHSIPLAGNQSNPYSLFSGAHLLDTINEQLLLSPAGIILWMVVILCVRRISLKDRITAFFVMVSVLSLLFAFLMDPKLGYARDWDLFSITGLGYTLLAVYLVLHYLEEAKIGRSNYVVLAIISTALFSTIPWLYLNAQEDKSVERFGALLEFEARGSGYGHEILGYYYRERGLINEETKQWEEALSAVKVERYAGSLGMGYLKSRRYRKSADAFRTAIQLNPYSAQNYNNLGIALFNQRQYDEAEKQYQAAIQLDSSFWLAHQNLGVLYNAVGQYDDAAEEITKAIHMYPDDFQMYVVLASVYNNMEKPREIIPFLKDYLKRKPEDRERVETFLEEMKIDLK
jgi:tetratricopeptide (TPR) repeat protein